MFSGVVRRTDAIVGMIDFIRTQSILIPCLKVVVTNKESLGPAPHPCDDNLQTSCHVVTIRGSLFVTEDEAGWSGGGDFCN